MGGTLPAPPRALALPGPVHFAPKVWGKRCLSVARRRRAVPAIPTGSLGYPVQAFRPAAPDITSRWDPPSHHSAAGECAAVPLSTLRLKPLGQKPRAPGSGRGGRVHEVLVHVAFMARSSPVSTSIAAHMDPPAVHLLRGLAHRDQHIRHLPRGGAGHVEVGAPAPPSRFHSA